MRKRIVPSGEEAAAAPQQAWLNLEELAEVEVSSEDAAHPIESALLLGDGFGWRAAEPGTGVLSARPAPAAAPRIPRSGPYSRRPKFLDNPLERL